MILFFKRGVGLLVLALLPATTQAQSQPSDSSRISYSEEILPEPLPELGSSLLAQKYGRFVRLQVEEHQLWKLGLNNFAGGGTAAQLDYARYGVHLAYERKLVPAWSVLAEVSPDVISYRTEPSGPWQHHLAARSQLAGRYYYNLSRRIRKGKSASNFSANYLSVALGAGFGRYSAETYFYDFSRTGRPVRLSGAVLYGLQRRLGRYGFADFNFGFPFRLTPDPGQFSDPDTRTITILLNLRIGLALGR